MTVSEIEDAGFSVAARVDVDVEASSGAVMASNIGHILIGITRAFQVNPPHCLLLLGDRGEMLAAALAALHLGIPIVHLHGGERSGTVDEPVRHAISKLSNFHLVSTRAAQDRLIRMGEDGDCIHVVGAPGLDGISDLATLDRTDLCQTVGFDSTLPIALLIYHPVINDPTRPVEDVRELIKYSLSRGFQVLSLMPNSDSGSDEIRTVLSHAHHQGQIALRTHLTRREFRPGCLLQTQCL